MTRQLITSALPYINGIKHLGNMVGSMLPADVYARYLRLRGQDVLYICATDEHGTPAELAAAEAKLGVAEFCAQQHEVQKRIYEGFGLSFDYFGRSSSPENAEITQLIARQLHAHGFIEQRSVRQVFSPADDRFLPDRYIEGTCPHCGYAHARGDQCENCTRVLDPTDLLDARSAISGSRDLEDRQTSHLFLLQSKLADEVGVWIDKTADDWPLLASSIARKWLTEGLQDRAITRDLEWGVAVPADTWPEMAAEGKVFYVWFDAPIEYIGATKEWAAAAQAGEQRDWKAWWYDVDEAVRYTQFMGKDNVPFHSVMFPATLLGTRDAWKKVDHLKAINWLNYYGGKFSTSRRRGIFTDAALELLPADYWRYFLIANAPESDDTSFTWDLFASSVNKDLADTLGNFVNRVLSFSSKRFGDMVPAGGEPGPAEKALVDRIAELLVELETNLDTLQFRKFTQSLRSMWSEGNAYLEEKAPWLAIKTDPEAAALTLRTAMNLIYLFGVLSAPLIPSSSNAIRGAFALVDDDRTWVNSDEIRGLDFVAAGTAFQTPPVLFAKISDDDIETYRSRFGAEEAAD